MAPRRSCASVSGIRATTCDDEFEEHTQVVKELFIIRIVSHDGSIYRLGIAEIGLSAGFL